MLTLGENLRRAREQRGVGLSQAALETRIRQAVLESLEAGDFTGLPPRPFVRGLLRNYAVYLNLDPDVVLDDYDQETGFKPVPPSLDSGRRAPLDQPAEPEPFSPRYENAPPDQTSPILDARHTSMPPRRPESDAAAFPSSAPEQPGARRVGFPPFKLPGKGKHSSPASPQEEGLDAANGFAIPQEAIEPVIDIVSPNESVDSQGITEGQRGPGDPPTLTQRIGGTRLPEVVAILSLAISLFGLVSIGSKQSAVFDLISRISLNQPIVPTATTFPTLPPGSSPTAVPTLNETIAATPIPLNVNGAETPGAPSGTVPATPTLDLPTAAQMTLEISADAAMFVRVIVDNVEALNGEMQNQTMSWTARERIYLQVKTIANGRVFLNGRRILPRINEERFDLQRAWQLSPEGTPVAVKAEPFLSTLTPTSSPTPLPTDTPTSSPTSLPTDTPTTTPTLTLTPTPTTTLILTSTPTASVTATRSATATATASSTLTATTSPTATASATATATATASATTTATSTLTASPTETETLTPSATATATLRPTPTRTQFPFE